MTIKRFIYIDTYPTPALKSVDVTSLVAAIPAQTKLNVILSWFAMNLILSDLSLVFNLPADKVKRFF